MRTMLVDGQGNFGSVDGDPPAAMRYTEARIAAPALDLLADINKNTVDFATNFDDTLSEPTVLPSAIPNLLVNGATGIAVGMATSIPPHNLGEVVDALVYMLEKWEKMDDISVEQLMNFIQGPDFPTGGVIIQEKGDEGIEAAYGSGRGKVTIQARAHVEEMERGKSRIIVSELPYQVNKSSLIERIAELVRGWQAGRHLGPARRIRPAGHAHRHRIDQERRSRRRAARALQAHAHAGYLQHHPAGAGGWRAAHAHAQAGPAGVSRTSY